MDSIHEPERFQSMTDEQLMEFVKAEGSKDASVLAKLIMIQRIRLSLLRERLGQRILTGTSIVLSIIALIVGVGGYTAFQNFLDDRAERTATSCRDDREDSINDNRNLEAQVDGLYFIESLSVDPVGQPIETAFVIAQVDKQVANIRSNYQKVRACTPAAIDEYNKTKGERGYEDGPTVEMAVRRQPIDIPDSLYEEADRIAEEQGN